MYVFVHVVRYLSMSERLDLCIGAILFMFCRCSFHHGRQINISHFLTRLLWLTLHFTLGTRQ